MNATVNILCCKSKVLANGENPLMIRVCKDGKKKYLSLGVSVNPKFGDFNRNKPKPNCPNKEHILQIISDRVKEYHEQVLEYAERNTIRAVALPKVILQKKLCHGSFFGSGICPILIHV